MPASCSIYKPSTWINPFNNQTAFILLCVFLSCWSDLDCVDIYINEKMIFKSFSFEQISPYLAFASVPYQVEIFFGWNTYIPFLKKELLHQNGAYITLALNGTTQRFS
jgi:hypothetical protein